MPKTKDYPGLYDKKGSYYGYFYEPRNTPPVRYYPLRTKNRRDAWAKYTRLKREHAEGTFDPWERAADRSVPFRVAVESYHKACAHQAGATRKRKRSVLNRFARHVRSKTTAQVTAADVRSFLDAHEIGAYTRSVYLREIRVALAHLQREGRCRTNVAAEAEEAEARYPVYHGAAKAVGRSALTTDQLAAILDDVRADRRDRAYLADVFDLAACCALRAGEVCAALRRHVHLHETLPVGTLEVTSYALPDGRRFNTKNAKSNRSVPLVPRAALLLRRVLAETEGVPDDYLFTKPRAGGGLDKEDVSKKFKEHREAVGFDRTVVLHSLRHTGLSWLTMLGVPPRDLMAFAGHGSLATQDRYVKIARRRLQGGAHAVASDLLAWLCPGADPAPVLASVPLAPLALGSFQGAIPSSHLAIEALFGGYLYRTDTRERFRNQLEALLASLDSAA